MKGSQIFPFRHIFLEKNQHYYLCIIQSYFEDSFTSLFVRQFHWNRYNCVCACLSDDGLSWYMYLYIYSPLCRALQNASNQTSDSNQSKNMDMWTWQRRQAIELPSPLFRNLLMSPSRLFTDSHAHRNTIILAYWHTHSHQCAHNTNEYMYKTQLVTRKMYCEWNISKSNSSYTCADKITHFLTVGKSQLKVSSYFENDISSQIFFWLLRVERQSCSD